jgi:hypothetical protein
MQENSMMRWIRGYEAKKHNSRLNTKQPKEGWSSSKFPIENMHWKELQQIFLPEVNLNFGQVISSLKRSWTAYRINRGSPRADLAWRILRLQNAMGLEPPTFLELEGMEESEEELTESTDSELTNDELAAKREEKEAAGELNIKFPQGTSEEESELYTGEEKELKQEELEAEKENDDW